MLYVNEKTKNISFPLGGIGSGSIGLRGNGELFEFEIHNRPNKISKLGYSHFAIKVETKGKSTVRVLHSDTSENLMGTPSLGFGYGPRGNTLAGFPHFRNLSFDGRFPIANLTFADEDFPARVELCAFNPFIPHNPDDSSIPAAFFEWRVENTTGEDMKIALAATLANPALSSKNEAVREGGMSGIFFGDAAHAADEVGYSDACLLTDHPDAQVQECWYRGGWQDSITTYWRNLSDIARMPERHYDEPGKYDHGTLTAYADVPAGGSVKIRFIISWNVPTAVNYWKAREGEATTWKNYYATLFENSLASAKYSINNFTSLYEKTECFRDALYSSTLPECVKDAAGANLAVLKSSTVLRIEDGSFWGWEGTNERSGSCYGSCQHVWNYAYAMPYLFPSLERSMREMTLNYALDESGRTTFRINLPPKKELTTPRACVDGQMGEVIKCYREWKISGDDEWLRRNAESIFRMLEYAWSPDNPDGWDADMDGVLEGRQHHTLDMELFGPSSWLEGFYLLALDLGARMAEFLGEGERASLYRRLYESGRRFMNENLFNGSYFAHRVDLEDKATLERYGAESVYWNAEAREIKYQVADGCIIDQMLADWHAALIGVPGVFDAEKKKTALRSLYKNNFKPSMREVTNMWRNFSLNDESGTVICSYPDGVRLPAIPIPYCEETMTGFEYALAGLMISEGLVSEGEQMVKAIRDRYDGEKRNPWNEIECGSNYARSMASFALVSIYSGFSFDMTEGRIGFAPISGSGKFFFSVKNSYGTAEISEGGARIKILGEPIELSEISLPDIDRASSVRIDGRGVSFVKKDGYVEFEKCIIANEICIE